MRFPFRFMEIHIASDQKFLSGGCSDLTSGDLGICFWLIMFARGLA